MVVPLHHSFPAVLNDLKDSVAVADGRHDSNIDVDSDTVEVYGLVAMTMVMMIELVENVVCLIGSCYC